MYIIFYIVPIVKLEFHKLNIIYFCKKDLFINSIINSEQNTKKYALAQTLDQL